MDLHTELLLSIFERVPSKLAVVAQTCKSWKAVVDGHFTCEVCHKVYRRCNHPQCGQLYCYCSSAPCTHCDTRCHKGAVQLHRFLFDACTLCKKYYCQHCLPAEFGSCHICGRFVCFRCLRRCARLGCARSYCWKCGTSGRFCCLGCRFPTLTSLHLESDESAACSTATAIDRKSAS